MYREIWNPLININVVKNLKRYPITSSRYYVDRTSKRVDLVGFKTKLFKLIFAVPLLLFIRIKLLTVFRINNFRIGCSFLFKLI